MSTYRGPNYGQFLMALSFSLSRLMWTQNLEDARVRVLENLTTLLIYFTKKETYLISISHN